MKNQKKSYIFGIITVLLWSTVATAFKLALENMEYPALLFISSAASFAVLYLINYAEIRKSPEIRLNELKNSALLGFLNPFLYYLVLFKAYSLLPAQIAQPLNYSWVFVVAILSHIVLESKVSRKEYLGLGAGFIGVILISTKGNFSGIGEFSIFGVLLALGSSVIWATYWIFNIKLNESSNRSLMLNFFFGTIYSLIYMIIAQPIFKMSGLGYALYIGLFEMGITFLTWNLALKYAESTAKIGSLIFFSPFLSLFFISHILDEQIYLSTIIGLLLIAGGAAYNKFATGKIS